MIDLTKLTPAPWVAKSFQADDGHDRWTTWDIFGDKNKEITRTGLVVDDAAFIALARNAFDVQERRRWWLMPVKEGWMICVRGNVIAEWPSDLSAVYGTLIEAWFAMVEADKLMPQKESTNAALDKPCETA